MDVDNLLKKAVKIIPFVNIELDHIKKIIRFVILGIVNTLLDYLLFELFLLYVSEQEMVCRFLSIIIAMFNSFFLNYYFVFKVKDKLRLNVRSLKLIYKFFTSNGIAMLINYLSFIGLRNIFEVNQEESFVMSTGLSVIINYLLNTIFVFNKY